MENALKGLMLAAGITITCIIISYGFYAAETLKGTADETVAEISEFRNRLKRNELFAYDGAIISGSELSNLMRQSIGNTSGRSTDLKYIEIVDSVIRKYSEYEQLERITERDSAEYIAPQASYRGEVIEEHGGAVIGVRFTKVTA